MLVQRELHPLRAHIFNRRDNPEMFRNGFQSFTLAILFGLTLGGGGTDSADCEFTVHLAWSDDSGNMIHNLEGMDVRFGIYTVHDPETHRSSYYLGSSFQ